MSHVVRKHVFCIPNHWNYIPTYVFIQYDRCPQFFSEETLWSIKACWQWRLQWDCTDWSKLSLDTHYKQVFSWDGSHNTRIHLFTYTSHTTFYKFSYFSTHLKQNIYTLNLHLSFHHYIKEGLKKFPRRSTQVSHLPGSSLICVYILCP